MANYPASLDALSNPTGATNQNDAGFLHSVQHGTANDILEQLEAKLGITDAPASNSPLANRVLTSLANGKSGWSQIASSMIGANAVTQLVSGTPIASSPAYASSSFGIVEGMQTIVTPLAPTSGQFVIFYYGTHYGSVVGTTFILTVYIDGVATSMGMQYVIKGVNEHFPALIIAPFSIPQGTHAVDIRQSISGGGGMVAYSAWRTFTVIEFKR
jgi:hypothetical protein